MSSNNTCAKGERVHNIHIEDGKTIQNILRLWEEATFHQYSNETIWSISWFPADRQEYCGSGETLFIVSSLPAPCPLFSTFMEYKLLPFLRHNISRDALFFKCTFRSLKPGMAYCSALQIKAIHIINTVYKTRVQLAPNIIQNIKIGTVKTAYFRAK